MATTEADTDADDGAAAAPLADLTAFRRDLLRAVETLERPSGLDVRHELEAAYDDHVNSGQLYPNLDRLVEMGLLEKGAKNRRANWYALTARGERELDAHRAWLGA